MAKTIISVALTFSQYEDLEAVMAALNLTNKSECIRKLIADAKDRIEQYATDMKKMGFVDHDGQWKLQVGENDKS